MVQLANPKPEFVTIAQALPSVRHAELRDGALRVDLAEPAVENPRLVAALVQAGAEVQFVTEDRASLEQVYLELVGPNGGGE